MTDLVQWNNCAGCMRKRSLLSEQPSYFISYFTETHNYKIVFIRSKNNSMQLIQVAFFTLIDIQDLRVILLYFHPANNSIRP